MERTKKPIEGPILIPDTIEECKERLTTLKNTKDLLKTARPTIAGDAIDAAKSMIECAELVDFYILATTKRLEFLASQKANN